MTDLTDTQRAILIAAAQRPDLGVLPLPDRIKGGAARKVLDALLKRGLIAETAAGTDVLVATEAGIRAVGMQQPEPASGGQAADEPAIVAAHAVPAQRAGTKQAQLIAMLQAPDGATIAEIAEAMCWRQHTVRGAIAGALKKRLGLDVSSNQVDGRGRVYRIGG